MKKNTDCPHKRFEERFERFCLFVLLPLMFAFAGLIIADTIIDQKIREAAWEEMDARKEAREALNANQ